MTEILKAYVIEKETAYDNHDDPYYNLEVPVAIRETNVVFKHKWMGTEFYIDINTGAEYSRRHDLFFSYNEAVNQFLECSEYYELDKCFEILQKHFELVNKIKGEK
jgi:hypothetical protein